MLAVDLPLPCENCRDRRERETTYSAPFNFLWLYLPHRRISTCSSSYKTTAAHIHVIERYESYSFSSFRIVICRLFFVFLSVAEETLFLSAKSPAIFWHSSSERGRFQHNASIVIETQRTVWLKGTGGHHQHEFEEGKTQQRRIVVDFIQLRRRS